VAKDSNRPARVRDRSRRGGAPGLEREAAPGRREFMAVERALTRSSLASEDGE